MQLIQMVYVVSRDAFSLISPADQKRLRLATTGEVRVFKERDIGRRPPEQHLMIHDMTRTIFGSTGIFFLRPWTFLFVHAITDSHQLKCTRSCRSAWKEEYNMRHWPHTWFSPFSRVQTLPCCTLLQWPHCSVRDIQTYFRTRFASLNSLIGGG